MSKFFSVDGALYKFMSRLWDMVKLNILWLFCSGLALKFILEYILLMCNLEAFRFLSYIPLFLMGAATTAVYSVTLKMVDEHEGYVGQGFFKAFRANFKQGCILGIIQMVAVYAIYIDFQFYKNAEQYNTLFLVIGVVASVLTFMHTVYAFPLLARYENTLIRTMKNSYAIMLRFFPRTIFLVAILVIEFLIIFWNDITILFGILVGPACIMLTISGITLYIFRRIETENAAGEEETDEERDLQEGK